MGELFGTDGIRGFANEYPINCEMALKIGKALGIFFKDSKEKANFIIGRDTRVSGQMLQSALISGICSTGADVHIAGVIPTPAVAFLTLDKKVNAGIMISASHNPFYDNGIKIFKSNGFKLSDEEELEIEKIIFEDHKNLKKYFTQDIGRVYHLLDARKKYKNFLKKVFNEKLPFKGKKIVIDCSNGASYQVGPELFSELGAEIVSLYDSPDGKNINKDCGSQHTDSLVKKVIELEADVGFAFDGDADRLIAVDEKGNVLSGDQIICICAKFAKEHNRLNNNLVVTTVMSNLGLRMALKNLNIDHIMSKVGDRYVLEDMIKQNAVIGGEDSGHMIFLENHTTGDGLFSALKLMEVLNSTSDSLSNLCKIMKVFPQVLMEVTVESKPDINTIDEVKQIINKVEADLGEKGRVLVRYSGTQPICRIMVEGPDINQTQKYCQQITDVIKQTITIKL